MDERRPELTTKLELDGVVEAITAGMLRAVEVHKELFERPDIIRIDIIAGGMVALQRAGGERFGG